MKAHGYGLWRPNPQSPAPPPSAVVPDGSRETCVAYGRNETARKSRERSVVFATDGVGPFGDMTRLALAMFRMHNPGWRSIVLDVGLTNVQRAVIAADCYMDFKPLKAAAGPFPTGRARLAMLEALAGAL